MRAILPPDDETRLVRDFFGGATGYFVDVGANDPQVGSQSWHLEQEGWTGILVEPQPDQRLALAVMAPAGARGLLDPDGLVAGFCHGRAPALPMCQSATGC